MKGLLQIWARKSKIMTRLSQAQVRGFKGVRITMSGSTQPGWETPPVAEPAFKGAPNTSEIPGKGRGLYETGKADRLKIC